MVKKDKKIIKGVIFDLPVLDKFIANPRTFNSIITQLISDEFQEEILSNYRAIHAFCDREGFVPGCTEKLSDKVIPPKTISQSDEFYNLKETLIESLKKDKDNGLEIIKILMPEGLGGNGSNKALYIRALLESKGFEPNINIAGYVGNNQEGEFVNNKLNSYGLNLVSNGLKSIFQKISNVVTGGDRKVLKDHLFKPLKKFFNLNFLSEQTDGVDFVLAESKVSNDLSFNKYKEFIDSLGKKIFAYTPPGPSALANSPVSLKKARIAAKRADIMNMNIEEATMLFLGKDYEEIKNQYHGKDDALVDDEIINLIKSKFRKSYIRNKTTDMLVITDGKRGAIAIGKDFEVEQDNSKTGIVTNDIKENTLGAGDAHAGIVVGEYIARRVNKQRITKSFMKDSMESGGRTASAVLTQVPAQLSPDAIMPAAKGEMLEEGGKVISVSNWKEKQILLAG